MPRVSEPRSKTSSLKPGDLPHHADSLSLYIFKFEYHLESSCHISMNSYYFIAEFMGNSSLC